MKKALLFAAACSLLAGCHNHLCQKYRDVDPADHPLTITRTAEKIAIDGKLDEKIWQQTPAYNLQQTAFFKGPERSMKRLDQDVFQQAEIRLAYDKENLYVAAKLYDEDIIQMDNEHQMPSYNNGDIFELFIKPKNKPFYWEIYVSPQNKRTSFFFRSSGVLIASNFAKSNFIESMRSAVQINGTLNKSEDRDKFWTFELAVPLKELDVKGEKFTAENPWTVLLARYNYDTSFRYVQLSTYPPLPIANNHLIEYYGDLKFK